MRAAVESRFSAALGDAGRSVAARQHPPRPGRPAPSQQRDGSTMKTLALNYWVVLMMASLTALGLVLTSS
ncbi:MAG: hypothetical protein Q8N44_07300 [Rubrivivax sp.]|nr:hypothetical protein [Rubrivivax sp.]MDP3083480.1 hypothetical protein [Rubrivivax sp.]